MGNQLSDMKDSDIANLDINRPSTPSSVIREDQESSGDHQLNVWYDDYNNNNEQQEWLPQPQYDDDDPSQSDVLHYRNSMNNKEGDPSVHVVTPEGPVVTKQNTKPGQVENKFPDRVKRRYNKKRKISDSAYTNNNDESQGNKSTNDPLLLKKSRKDQTTTKESLPSSGMISTSQSKAHPSTVQEVFNPRISMAGNESCVKVIVNNDSFQLPYQVLIKTIEQQQNLPVPARLESNAKCGSKNPVPTDPSVRANQMVTNPVTQKRVLNKGPEKNLVDDTRNKKQNNSSSDRMLNGKFSTETRTDSALQPVLLPPLVFKAHIKTPVGLSSKFNIITKPGGGTTLPKSKNPKAYDGKDGASTDYHYLSSNNYNPSSKRNTITDPTTSFRSSSFLVSSMQINNTNKSSRKKYSKKQSTKPTVSFQLPFQPNSSTTGPKLNVKEADVNSTTGSKSHDTANNSIMVPVMKVQTNDKVDTTKHGANIRSKKDRNPLGTSNNDTLAVCHSSKPPSTFPPAYTEQKTNDVETNNESRGTNCTPSSMNTVPPAQNKAINDLNDICHGTNYDPLTSSSKNPISSPSKPPVVPAVACQMTKHPPTSSLVHHGQEISSTKEIYSESEIPGSSCNTLSSTSSRQPNPNPAKLPVLSKASQEPNNLTNGTSSRTKCDPSVNPSPKANLHLMSKPPSHGNQEVKDKSKGTNCPPLLDQSMIPEKSQAVFKQKRNDGGQDTNCQSKGDQLSNAATYPDSHPTLDCKEAKDGKHSTLSSPLTKSNTSLKKRSAFIDVRQEQSDHNVAISVPLSNTLQKSSVSNPPPLASKVQQVENKQTKDKHLGTNSDPSLNPSPSPIAFPALLPVPQKRNNDSKKSNGKTESNNFIGVSSSKPPPKRSSYPFKPPPPPLPKPNKIDKIATKGGTPVGSNIKNINNKEAKDKSNNRSTNPKPCTPKPPESLPVPKVQRNDKTEKSRTSYHYGTMSVLVSKCSTNTKSPWKPPPPPFVSKSPSKSSSPPFVSKSPSTPPPTPFVSQSPSKPPSPQFVSKVQNSSCEEINEKYGLTKGQPSSESEKLPISQERHSDNEAMDNLIPDNSNMTGQVLKHDSNPSKPQPPPPPPKVQHITNIEMSSKSQARNTSLVSNSVTTSKRHLASNQSSLHKSKSHTMDGTPINDTFQDLNNAPLSPNPPQPEQSIFYSKGLSIDCNQSNGSKTIKSYSVTPLNENLDSNLLTGDDRGVNGKSRETNLGEIFNLNMRSDQQSIEFKVTNFVAQDTNNNLLRTIDGKESDGEVERHMSDLVSNPSTNTNSHPANLLPSLHESKNNDMAYMTQDPVTNSISVQNKDSKESSGEAGSQEMDDKTQDTNMDPCTKSDLPSIVVSNAQGKDGNNSNGDAEGNISDAISNPSSYLSKAPPSLNVSKTQNIYGNATVLPTKEMNPNENPCRNEMIVEEMSSPLQIKNEENYNADVSQQNDRTEDSEGIYLSRQHAPTIQNPDDHFVQDAISVGCWKIFPRFNTSIPIDSESTRLKHCLFQPLASNMDLNSHGNEEIEPPTNPAVSGPSIPTSRPLNKRHRLSTAASQVTQNYASNQQQSETERVQKLAMVLRSNVVNADAKKLSSVCYSSKEFMKMCKEVEADMGETFEEMEDGKDFKKNSHLPAGTSAIQLSVPYGRIECSTLHKIFVQALNLQPNDVFVDLGHGIGLANIQAAYTFGCESRGIEIYPKRYAASIDLQQAFERKHTSNNSLYHRNAPVGSVRLINGRMEDPANRDFIVEPPPLYRNVNGAFYNTTKVFVNNFEDSFGQKEATKLSKVYLDAYVAGLFAMMVPGSIMVTLSPLPLPPSKHDIDKIRKKQGLPATRTNSSFYEVRKLSFGPAKGQVSWGTQRCSDELSVWIYTRLPQDSDEPFFFCSNPSCTNSKDKNPAVRTVTNPKGEVGVITEPSCSHCSMIQKHLRRSKMNI